MHHTALHTLPAWFQIAILDITIVFMLALYFLPIIMAIKKNSPHTTAVVILNIFLGFTLIGWVAALVLATKQPQPVIVVYSAPPPPQR